jgi:hypothetical protein
MPKESQKTENKPHAIIGKNCAWIQRKIVARRSRTGPVKKNMPLFIKISALKFTWNDGVKKRGNKHNSR